MKETRYSSEDIAGFIRHGDVAEGVPFEWWLANADGAGFCLVPTKGVHTDEQVKRAKQELMRNRDVVGRIGVYWVNPSRQTALSLSHGKNYGTES